MVSLRVAARVPLLPVVEGPDEDDVVVVLSDKGVPVGRCSDDWFLVWDRVLLRSGTFLLAGNTLSAGGSRGMDDCLLEASRKHSNLGDAAATTDDDDDDDESTTSCCEPFVETLMVDALVTFFAIESPLAVCGIDSGYITGMDGAVFRWSSSRLGTK